MSENIAKSSRGLLFLTHTVYCLLHRYLIFATGAFVIGITALDSDRGFNGQVTYYLNTSNEHRYFSINATTGVITTRQTLTSSMTSQFSLIATAADMVQTHLRSCDVSITVLRISLFSKVMDLSDISKRSVSVYTFHSQYT